MGFALVSRGVGTPALWEPASVGALVNPFPAGPNVGVQALDSRGVGMIRVLTI